MSLAQADALRHAFVVIIPVADRPQHLANLLASLLAQCRLFPHGGGASRVTAVIADDSADDQAIVLHRELAADFARHGLATQYFGAAEQARLLASLPTGLRAALRNIVGEPERTGFRHKGASVTRNLACLLASRMRTEDEPQLFMFVDSDEQFKVRVAGAQDEPDRDVHAIDYFGCLDQIFATGEVDILTGKVVGDPPVSPAVMAGNFLEDVIGLLRRMAAVDPAAACSFHDARNRIADAAAYHDMADLFGFASGRSAFAYRCALAGAHDHARCLAHFAAGLDRFFDGEHPTRVGYYWPTRDCRDTQPARTVYTGNYVCNRAGLLHFIPFAPLKLRMAGPVLGRLVGAEIGPRFVSANLPLLHTRTTEGTAEYRPGVARRASSVDLSGEFERQYYGDVMLFTMERLIPMGYPARTLTAGQIRAALDAVETTLRSRHAALRATVRERLEQARAEFDGVDAWWNRPGRSAEIADRFQSFFSNLERNFGGAADPIRRITSADFRDDRLAGLSQALAGYALDRSAWTEAMEAPV